MKCLSYGWNQLMLLNLRNMDSMSVLFIKHQQDQENYQPQVSQLILLCITI